MYAGKHYVNGKILGEMEWNNNHPTSPASIEVFCIFFSLYNLQYTYQTFLARLISGLKIKQTLDEKMYMK